MVLAMAASVRGFRVASGGRDGEGERDEVGEAGEMDQARDGQRCRACGGRREGECGAPCDDSGDGGGGGERGERGEGVSASEAAIRATGQDGVVLTGRHLRAMRAAAGLSVRDLGVRVSYSWQAIWSWEAETRAIPSAMYLPLVEACTAARRERDARFGRVRAGYLALVPLKTAKREGGDA